MQTIKMMTNNSRLYSVIFILFLLPLHIFAQIDNEVKDQNIETSELDSVSASTIFEDSTALPWPLNKQEQLQALLNNKMFKTSQVGMMVYDITADSTIFQFNEKQLLRPASTMKLITSITALDKLGGGYQFKTSLWKTGNIEDRVLKGNVYCVGGFDPMFNNDDMHAFVNGLKELEIDTIAGYIFADTSMKDGDKWGEGWCWDDDNPTLTPLLISGKDRFMERLMHLLQEAGITVTMGWTSGTKPYEAVQIESRFHTIDQVLMKMMKDSNNLYAEAMFYQLASSAGRRPSSAKDARTVIKQLITKLRKDPNKYKIADGSGLSLYNYVSAELEVEFLKYAYNNKNIFRHLDPSLPSAGVDGTLKKRMQGQYTRSNVHAKTGTLTGISSLAGYCTASNGHFLCFAIINQGLIHNSNGRAFQNKVCEILCAP